LYFYGIATYTTESVGKGEAVVREGGSIRVFFPGNGKDICREVKNLFQEGKK
jgi:hypothetical protein